MLRRLVFVSASGASRIGSLCSARCAARRRSAVLAGVGFVSTAGVSREADEAQADDKAATISMDVILLITGQFPRVT